MPRACAAAAATGLPETDDFHLKLGRAIARANDDWTEGDFQAEAMRRSGMPGVGILEGYLDHTFDREDGLITALATLPATSLAGAAVQLAAAARVFDWVTSEEKPEPEHERALRRLLSSALTVMVDAAGLDASADGINALSSPISNPWRDPYERIEEAVNLNSSAKVMTGKHLK